MSSRRVTLVASFVIVAGGTLPPSVEAQSTGRVIFTPYVGVFVPSSDVGVLSRPLAGAQLRGRVEHRTAPAFGANMSYWLTDRAAVELSGLYTASDVRGMVAATAGSENFTESIADNAYVWFGSAKFLVKLLPPEKKYNVRFGIGPAIINRGGSAYKSEDGEEITGLTDFGAAMSLCTRIPVTNILGIRLRAENFMYRSKLIVKNFLDGEDLTFNDKVQNDFVFSAGLQLFMNR